SIPKLWISTPSSAVWSTATAPGDAWCAWCREIRRCIRRCPSRPAGSMTPGVPAYAAAAARVGRELTVPLVAQSVVLTRTRQRSTAMPETESLKAFAATRATLVLHLAITAIRSLMDEIAPAYGPACPAVVVYRASQSDEMVLRGT